MLVEEGGAIVERRRAVLEELAPPLASAHAEIAPGEDVLAPRATRPTHRPGPAETPADALRRRLAETADKEIWNGQTLVGPHRDDVRFLLGGRDLAVFGSRGQQRTAILALKLAELDLLARGDGVAPLLLLDDVFSELDPGAPRTPCPPYPRAAAGLRHDHGARGPRPRARGGIDRVAGHGRAAGAARAVTEVAP